MTTEQITRKQWPKITMTIYDLMVSVSQEFGSSSAGWLLLRVSPEVAVRR